MLSRCDQAPPNIGANRGDTHLLACLPRHHLGWEWLPRLVYDVSRFGRREREEERPLITSGAGGKDGKEAAVAAAEGFWRTVKTVLQLYETCVWREREPFCYSTGNADGALVLVLACVLQVAAAWHSGAGQ